MWAGVDVGVKGSAFTYRNGEPMWVTWNIQGDKTTDALTLAVRRGETAGAAVNTLLDGPHNVVVDMPVWIKGKGSYGYGNQTALFGALVATLTSAGHRAIPMRGATARSLAGVGRGGKDKIIDFGLLHVPGLPKVGWKRETVAEACMLRHAGVIAGVELV